VINKQKFAKYPYLDMLPYSTASRRDNGLAAHIFMKRTVSLPIKSGCQQSKASVE